MVSMMLLHPPPLLQAFVPPVQSVGRRMDHEHSLVGDWPAVAHSDVVAVGMALPTMHRTAVLADWPDRAFVVVLVAGAAVVVGRLLALDVVAMTSVVAVRAVVAAVACPAVVPCTRLQEQFTPHILEEYTRCKNRMALSTSSLMTTLFVSCQNRRRIVGRRTRVIGRKR